MKQPLIALIASLNPAPALEVTVQSLFDGGANRVIIVDNGSSDPVSKKVLKNVKKAGAEVIHLKKNVGKAEGLKIAFRTVPKNCIIVQTDDDTIAGDLTRPLALLRAGKADIVDVRCETMHTNSIIGMMQELVYWLVNAVPKRIQSWLDARLWMSGASVLYTYEAGKILLLEPAYSLTEDTEGLFRARTHGMKAHFYAGREAQFLTMVPEDFRSLHRQWKRWTTGNAQIMGMYGFGGGSARVAAVNAFCWADMFFPFIFPFRFGLESSLLWSVGCGAIYGIIGAIRLKRARLLIAGLFMPIVTIFWAYLAVAGFFFAWRLSKTGEQQLTWVSPTRTSALENA